MKIYSCHESIPNVQLRGKSGGKILQPQGGGDRNYSGNIAVSSRAVNSKAATERKSNHDQMAAE
ncbi:MAG: hypothetical protein PHN84_00205 [Desulfuromonadaceae bacterium]|nr:hypothetical protein [Desulfuromonadaceae bacterium]